MSAVPRRGIWYGILLIVLGALANGFLSNLLAFASNSPFLFNAFLSLARFGLLPAGSALVCAGIILGAIVGSAATDELADGSDEE